MSKYYYQLESKVRQKVPNITNSQLLMATNYLTPVFQAKGQVTDQDITSAMAQVKAQETMAKLPEVVQEQLTNVYNALSAPERLALVRAPNIDAEVKQTIDDLNAIGRMTVPDYKIMGPDGTIPGIPEAPVASAVSEVPVVSAEPAPVVIPPGASVNVEPVSALTESEDYKNALKEYIDSAKYYYELLNIIYKLSPDKRRERLRENLSNGELPKVITKIVEEAKGELDPEFFSTETLNELILPDTYAIISNENFNPKLNTFLSALRNRFAEVVQTNPDAVKDWLKMPKPKPEKLATFKRVYEQLPYYLQAFMTAIKDKNIFDKGMQIIVRSKLPKSGNLRRIFDRIDNAKLLKEYYPFLRGEVQWKDLPKDLIDSTIDLLRQNNDLWALVPNFQNQLPPSMDPYTGDGIFGDKPSLKDMFSLPKRGSGTAKKKKVIYHF